MKEGIVVSDVVRIRPTPTKIVVEYLEYVLNSPASSNQLKNGTIGSTRPRVNLSHVRRLKISIPPIPEQRKIAAILSTVDENIQKTQQIIEKTEQLKKGLMQQLLTRGIGHTRFKQTKIGEIPEEWKVVQIKDICRVKRGASPRPIVDQSYFADSGRGWARIEDVTPTYKYLRRTTQYLSPKGVSRSVSVNPGDLIMSICATIGRPIIVDMEACIHDGFVWFSDISQDLYTEFFFYVLKAKEQYFVGQRQTGTQGNLNTGIVGRTLIPVPPIKEQHRIASILSTADKKTQEERNHRAELEELKKGLMQVLLTGKVRVKNV